ncbi:MAG: MltA domain-containing protein [Gammaproteobacteria bacterium]|nr:MltA domain-containing protein [Gammaproteobacteria bacterium]
MTQRSKFILLTIGIVALCAALVFYWQTPKHPSIPTQPELIPEPVETVILKPASFSELPGWSTTQTLKSLEAFQLSCQRLIHLKPTRPVGNEWLPLQAKDWFRPCRAALKLKSPSEQKAKSFFETWFQPQTFVKEQPIVGLFTGYYAPQIAASLQKTEAYPTPIYGVPKDLIVIKLNDFDPALPARKLMGHIKHNRMKPYYSRAEIDQGAIKHTAPVIAYVRNPIDRLFLEIQGSGTLKFEDGSQANLGYAGKNGLSYTAIGRVLIRRGILNSKTVSMQNIQKYLESHPAERNNIINKNRSFVFFKTMTEEGAYGTQGAKLTPGYSLAVDPSWVPLGMPIWLNTTRPDSELNTNHPLNRLMIAQDTGGAIKGTVRGDVFWGNDNQAAAIAGKMKNHGRYWLLTPKSRLAITETTKNHETHT